MESLINAIENLKKDSIKNIIDLRMQEFRDVGKRSLNDIFKELCFCLMTANFQAERSIKIQNFINEGFHDWTEEKLASTLKEKLNVESF